MANNSRLNPMIVDTASSARLVTDTTVLSISGIKVVPNNTTWSVILKDGSGNIVYQDATNQGAEFMTTPWNTTGLVVDTLTNITAVYIYLVPSR
jgi:hypothetical protein